MTKAMTGIGKDEKSSAEEKRIYDIVNFQNSFSEGMLCGVDEVGRGPLAGPVLTCAVIFPRDVHILSVNDSKKLSEKKRAGLYRTLIDNAVAVGIGIAGPDVIDEVNIRQATFIAMRQSIKMLYDSNEKCMLYEMDGFVCYEYHGITVKILNDDMLELVRKIGRNNCRPDFVLADGFDIPELDIPQASMAKGDSKCFSIAGASIIAKVTRDAIMDRYDEIYPGYGFASGKGYGTKEHIEALKNKGILPIHRASFIKNFV